LTKRHRFPQLLDHPGRRRMRRHSKVHDLATGMIQDHKDVEDLKAERRNSEEVVWSKYWSRHKSS
jgi:hypothetical protein